MRDASRAALSQRLRAAMEAHRAGHLAAAKRAYQRVLEEQPHHPDALHLLGLIEHRTGSAERAEHLIREAIAAEPRVASYHNNLGKVLEERERIDEALSAYAEAARLDPADPDTRFNRGLVLQRHGRLEEAEAAYREALLRNPDDAECHYNLATVLKDREQLRPAIEAYRASLRLRPASGAAHNDLGNVLQRVGEVGAAIDCYRQALASRPNDPRYRLNLGSALLDAGDAQAAAEQFRAVVDDEPTLAEGHRRLARALATLGHTGEAVRVFREALRLEPGHAGVKNALVAALALLRPTAYEPELEEALLASFAEAGVNRQLLARLAANQLLFKHRDRAGGGDAALAASALGADPLLEALLSHTFNVDSELERVLTEARREMLLALRDSGGLTAAQRRLGPALALQCFNNEHVFARDETERLAVEALRVECERISPTPSAKLEERLLVLALYLPVHELDCAAALGAAGPSQWSAPLRPVIERALEAPLEEAKLAQSIESSGAIEDPTSRAVRAQYEEHPYPRWLDLPARPPSDPWTVLRARFPHFEPPGIANVPARVLVAGCGTGQAAIGLALSYERCQIVAQDLSRRSLAYAKRMARELGACNIRFLHGDLLALPLLDERFDVIECTGVLHHLTDPMRGWRVLTELTRPGGVMRIGLYSERARAAVVAAKAWIGELGLRPTGPDIRAFRQRVMGLDPAHRLGELRLSEDFYTLGACRDLLFHVEEHRFTLPHVRSALAELGLELLGFELPSPQMRLLYRRAFPHDASLTDLAAWDEFERENPRAFSGMYLFWCQKRMDS